MRMFVLIFLGSLLRKLAKDVKEEMDQWYTASAAESQSEEGQ